MSVKVVLLGDSIRQIGYGKHVSGILGEDYEVWQPDDNCRFAAYTFRMLFDYSRVISGADIVHWNDGLWDLCDLFGDGPFTPKDEYIKIMLRICDQLKKMCGTVIFATTSPVRIDTPYHIPDRIRDYNETLVPLLKERGVVINDLWGLLADDVNGNIREDDKLHLTQKAEFACAHQTANIIKEIAEQKYFHK